MKIKVGQVYQAQVGDIVGARVKVLFADYRDVLFEYEVGGKRERYSTSFFQAWYSLVEEGGVDARAELPAAAFALAEQAEHCVIGYSIKSVNIRGSMHRLAELAGTVRGLLNPGA